MGNSGIGEFHRSYLLRNHWPFVERAVRRAIDRTYSGNDADALVEAVRHYYESPFPELREDHLFGNMANVIAGRIANYYDFRSASCTVDGASTSSLLAVINACSQLESGDMDVALAGGVGISLDPLGWSASPRPRPWQKRGTTASSKPASHSTASMSEPSDTYLRLD